MVCFLFLFSILVFASAQELNVSDNSSSNNFSYSIDQNNTNNSPYSERIEILGVNPVSFQKGDVQFAVQVLNNKSTEARNIIAVIFGKGYSTYSLDSISSLKQGERGYLLVQGSFKESGVIMVNIQIDGNSRILNFSVIDSENAGQVQVNKEEVQRELEILKQNYSLTEELLAKKKKESYDVSFVSLDDAKDFLRSAESSLLTGKVIDAQAQTKLASEELNSQISKLYSVGKKSLLSKLKDNAVVFSTIAGALIAFFTLYELLKKKSTTVVNKVKEVNVNFRGKD